MHSAVCAVNGEATDGTRNTPVLMYEDPRLGRPTDGAPMAGGDLGTACGEGKMQCAVWTAPQT